MSIFRVLFTFFFLVQSSGVIANCFYLEGADRIDQRALPLDCNYSADYTGQGVHIYIMDTGYDDLYSDQFGIAGSRLRAVEHYNAMHPGVSAEDQGQEPHGDWVAFAAGSDDYGVAPGAYIHHVRINNYLGHATESDFIRGADWVVAHVQQHEEPAVANFSSWAEFGSSELVDQAVQRMLDAGITVTVAAGNYGSAHCTLSQGALSPMHIPGVILVGATSFNDSTDWFSGYSNHGSCVDILAPGRLNYYARSGTSFAAPRVAGVAALYLERYPDANPSMVKAAILNAGTANVITDVPANTANLLLHNKFSEPSLPEISTVDLVQGATCNDLILPSQGGIDEIKLCKSSLIRYGSGDTSRYNAIAGNGLYDNVYRVDLNDSEPSGTTASFSTHYHDKYWGYSFALSVDSGNARVQIQSKPYTTCNSSYSWQDVYTTVAGAQVFVVDVAKVMNQRVSGCLSEDTTPANRLMFRFRLVDGATEGGWAYMRPILMRRD